MYIPAAGEGGINKLMEPCFHLQPGNTVPLTVRGKSQSGVLILPGMDSGYISM